jgi:hypothetical protein
MQLFLLECNTTRSGGFSSRAGNVANANTGRRTRQNTEALPPFSDATRDKVALGAANGKKSSYAQTDPANHHGWESRNSPIAFSFSERRVERRAAIAVYHVVL